MNLKNKFHLTLVVLITLGSTLWGIPHTVFSTDTAQAFDFKNQVVYNKNISNIYNNINIKYISIKLYNININNNIYKRKVNLSKSLNLSLIHI